MSQVQRRKFLIVTGVLLAAPRVRAQQAEKVRRVGILVTNLRGGGASYVEAMKAGLRERGWIEGKNLEIDLRDPDGNTDLFRKLAADETIRRPGEKEIPIVLQRYGVEHNLDSQADPENAHPLAGISGEQKFQQSLLRSRNCLRDFWNPQDSCRD